MSDQRPHLWRSRWAAIGAAVAVTLGAGGLVTTFADSPASSLVAIAPVRVLDTRLPAMAPALISAQPRLLDVTGTIPTVGADGATVTNAQAVPDGATAIVANVTAVGPTTPGFVAVRPGTATGQPTTSSINLTAAGVIVPNSVTVEIPTSGVTAGQIQLWFQGTDAAATTAVLVDIVGYYVAGPSGPAGPRGFSAWDTIPSGVTVTGEFVHDGSAANASSDVFSVDLPGRAPVALTDTDVNFAPDSFAATIDDDPSCTGTRAAPTAPPGKVCIYSNQAPGNYNSVRGNAALSLPTQGFAIQGTPVTVGFDSYFYVTWAYTAP